MKTKFKLLLFLVFASSTSFGQTYGQNAFYVTNNTGCDVEAQVIAVVDPTCPVNCAAAQAGAQPSSPVGCLANSGATLIHSGGGTGEWSDVEIREVGHSSAQAFDGCNGQTGAVDCSGTLYKVVYDDCENAHIETI